MNIKRSIVLRVRIAFLLVGLFALAIIYKMAHIQWAEGKQWKQQAQQIGLQYLPISATRGNIYSDNGSLLATSLPFYELALDPTIANEETFRTGIDSLAYLLSSFFGDKSMNDYRARIEKARNEKRQYLRLNRRKIGYQDKKVMEGWPIFREGRMKGGVLFRKVEERFNPFGSLGHRTIGYMTNDNLNGAGLEYSFNGHLAGQDGQALFQKMAGGNWKPIYDGSEVRPVEGLDVETTIDINIQDVAASALRRHLTDHEADYGCVVVMEVKTGEIKAMVNLKKRPQGNYAEDYNYAVGAQGATEPGSTFKLASMIALLEDSNLRLNDTIDTGNGEYKFYDRTMNDAKRGGFGRLSVKDAFAKSSNIAVSRLVNAHFGLEPQRYVDYLRTMGLTDPLGFQIKGEGQPYIKEPTDASWSGTTLPWMSIGYELELTPIHTLAFYNAIANNGKMIRPIIVKRVRHADKVRGEFSSDVIRDRICTKETLAKVRSMLEEVVASGTANNINGAHYKIAGKTGTAQKLVDGRYSKRNYYTSFAGYFPAEAPQYSAIVVIDNPKGYRQYGSDVAAPVFKEIADKLYATDIAMHALYTPEDRRAGVFPVIRAGYRPNVERICAEMGISVESVTGDDWVRTRLKGDTVQLVSAKVELEKVPDVRGMTLRHALPLLENRGLRVHYSGTGRVARQSISPGRKALEGSEIRLTLN